MLNNMDSSLKKDSLIILHKLYEYRTDTDGLDKTSFFDHGENQKAANIVTLLANKYGLIQVIKKNNEKDRYILSQLAIRVLEINYDDPFAAINQVKEEMASEAKEAEERKRKEDNYLDKMPELAQKAYDIAVSSQKLSESANVIAEKGNVALKAQNVIIEKANELSTNSNKTSKKSLIVAIIAIVISFINLLIILFK